MMRAGIVRATLISFLFLCIASASTAGDEETVGSSTSQTTRPLDSKERARVVQRICALVTDLYFSAPKGRAIAAKLRGLGEQDAYHDFKDGQEFAQHLTLDLQTISEDNHFRVRFYAAGLPPDFFANTGTRNVTPEVAALGNFGFAGAEWLPGNVGYLDIRAFLPLKLSATTATAAMTFVAQTDALIIDVRENAGGEPETIAYVTSYLFDDKTHLTDIRLRDAKKDYESWTLSSVPGQRFGGKKPIYVLTSRRTSSGGEEFAYNLKVLKRAVLVGEATRGHADVGVVEKINEHFTISIPHGQAISPITQTNWDNSGVIPSVKISSQDSVETAYRMAVEELIPGQTDPERLKSLKAVRAHLH